MSEQTLNASRQKARRARESDAKVLWHIETACFDDSWEVATLRASLNRDEYCAVVCETDPAVGYAIGRIVADEAELMRIAVMPQRRGQGIGKVLLAALLDAFREEGAGKVFLEVRQSNVAAISLYQEAGFVKTGTRPWYYGNGEDAVNMAIDLQELPGRL